MAEDTMTLSGTVNASGVAELVIRTVARQRWTVKQITVNGTITGATSVGAGAQCSIFKNGDLVTRVVAQGGTAAGEPFVPLGPGEKMTVRWTSATVGATVAALVIYDDGERAR